MSLSSRIRGFVGDYLLVLGRSARQLPMVLVSILAISALDLLAVALVAPFTAAMMGQEVRFAGLELGIIGSNSNRRMFGWLGLTIMIVFVVKAFAGFRLTRWINRFSERRRAELMVELLHGLQHKPYTYHLQRNSVDLVSRLLTLTGAYSGAVLASSLRLCADGIVALALSVMLLWRDPMAFCILLLVLGAVFYLVNRHIRPRLAHASTNYYRCAGEAGVAVAQALGALREVRLLGREQFFRERLGAAATEMSEHVGVQQSLSQVPRLAVEAAVVCFLVLLSWITLAQGRELHALIAVLGMFAVAAMRMMPATTSILTSFSTLRSHRVQLAELAAELRTLAAEQHPAATPAEVGSVLGEQFQSVALCGACFTYDARAQPALEGVDLRIDRGQVVGIMGRSGAGKSTLADVMLGLLELTAGQMRVNGQVLDASTLRHWQRMVAYIPQSVFLVDDSVRRNIALGVPDAEIDTERLEQAVRQAQLAEVVAGLPQGLDTQLGERGVRLSGGQRQRIAVARALYHEREFIIMDEATSALDAETERELIEAIGALHGKKTLLVIAHKATVLEEADVIHHFEAGRLVRSTHPRQDRLASRS